MKSTLLVGSATSIASPACLPAGTLKSADFKQAQRFRAGIEGRISVLFRGRGMKCSNSGTAGGEVRNPAHRAQLRIKFGFETWEQGCMMLESTCPMNAPMHAVPTTSRR